LTPQDRLLWHPSALNFLDLSFNALKTIDKVCLLLFTG
jgi:hypothetical protein